MAKMKIAEVLLAAISALVAAAKSVIRFFSCVGRMKPEPAQT